jgi:N-acyl-phosphatidylethanolamine-hydrolysing phospholipase D
LYAYQQVTDEWREPGFWEFIIHQLLRPLSGRVWWNGGMPKDPSLAAASLPIEEPDFASIRRHSWHSSVPQSSLHVPSSVETEESTRSSSPSSEEGWERLEASKSGPLASESTSSKLSTPAISTPTPGTMKASYQEMTVTWFGQSTSLVQMAGITFLTDPVFSVKPMDNFLAPSRLRPTPCSLNRLLELNVVDYVLISHNHFDHLDIDVVKALGNSVSWLIPKGLHAFFVKQNGIHEDKVIVMDWWEETVIKSPAGDIDIACTPTQHWSGRTPLDTNKSLWCGFVVKHADSGKSFFHAGDTGYSSGEHSISSRSVPNCQSTLADLE